MTAFPAPLLRGKLAGTGSQGTDSDAETVVASQDNFDKQTSGGKSFSSPVPQSCLDANPPENLIGSQLEGWVDEALTEAANKFTKHSKDDLRKDEAAEKAAGVTRTVKEGLSNRDEGYAKHLMEVLEGSLPIDP